MSGDFLRFEILQQPDLTTCGPTCLHAVYRYFGEEMDLPELIQQVPRLDEGGTLGVMLGLHALQRGYRVDLISYNVSMFDPTWFATPDIDWVGKLTAQGEVKSGRRFRRATRHYIQFVQAGGRLRMEDLRADLIRRFLRKGIPILTGLSSTFLYREPRVIGESNTPDDIRGTPEGHFVVLCGYLPERREVMVADPYFPNPLGTHSVYPVPMARLINAILLGIVTFDANLLVIRPRHDHRPLSTDHPPATASPPHGGQANHHPPTTNPG
jgi:hypothetical protein